MLKTKTKTKTKGRTIRFNKSEEEVRQEAAKSKQESARDLLGRTSASKLTSAQVDLLIDSVTEWDTVKKQLEKEVKIGKALLLEHAELKQWKTRAAAEAVCTIKPSSSTEVDVSGLAKLLKKMGKKELFVDLVKVKSTDAKKYLGENSLEECSEVVTVEYGTVTLKSTK